ncbi:MAG: type IV pilus biogenesis protein PilM [Sandaracinaceae bacterium]
MAMILGLDIDPKVVRGVLLKTALRNHQVVRYLTSPIAPADTPEGRAESRASAVRTLLGSLGQPVEKVITELSGDEVSIRKLAFPAKVQKKIPELLPHELEGEVPFDPMESVLDFQPIEISDGFMRVLAAVAPKSAVKSHLDQMRDLGVDPREVGVGAVALDGLAGLLPTLATPGPHCLVDIHPEGTDVCILRNGVCHFARTISVSEHDLDAGESARLSRELKQTLAAYRMEGGLSPSAFYACGAMATREGTAAWLSTILGAPVEVLPLPAAPGADAADLPAYSRAAALAGRTLGRGRRLDARQGEFAAKQAANALRQHVPLIGACAFVILAAFIFSSYARYSVLDARHSQLEDQLAHVTEQYFRTEERSPDEALALLERGARGDDPMPDFDAYDALAGISSVIPESITHDVQQLQIDLGDGDETGRFSLRGTVDSESDFDAVVTALRGHRLVRGEGDTAERLVCFHNLEPGDTSGTAEGRRSYRLEGEIGCRPEGQSGGDQAEGNSRSGRSRRNASGGSSGRSN